MGHRYFHSVADFQTAFAPSGLCQTSSSVSARRGIVASLPDVARWIRALFSDTILPPQQKTELFSLVSQTPGQPIGTTSPLDPGGFSLGIGQARLANAATPVWFYQGSSLGYRVGWFHRSADDLIVVIGLNSLATGPDNKLSSLYATVFGILEPGSLVNSAAAPPATKLGSVPN
jgi:CubicO group peptidase (beta-lactamase class C family)